MDYLNSYLKFGYARVSTSEQNLDMQLKALMAADYDKIYYDTISGTKRDCSHLDELLNLLRSGDEIVVWRQDRLRRSLLHTRLSHKIRLSLKKSISSCACSANCWS